MLRFATVLRAARSHYEVLGVAKDASTEEVKKAFRQRAQRLHPDKNVGNADATRQFRECVEAYRVLRDPDQRSDYDRSRAGPSSGPQPWGPPGSGAGGGYGMSSGAPTRQAAAPGNEALTTVTLLSLGFMFVLHHLFKDDGVYEDPRHEPRRMPTSDRISGQRSGSASISSASPSATTVAAAVSSATSGDPAPSAPAADQEAQSLVRAFMDPFTKEWSRIPEGYEAPNVTDMLKWHKERMDPKQWNSMYANGTLSQIVPRGTLLVRMKPMWATQEPIMLCDPVTNKTVFSWERDKRDQPKVECSVAF